MKDAGNIKETVRLKYAGIAGESGNCCCGQKKEPGFSVFNECYEDLNGYVKEADLNLGCGVPTEYAGIKPGDRVLDLGCGAGNDCFVARSIVGGTGHVTGLDFTDEMLIRARSNALKLGFRNMDFIKGDIEAIPLEDGTFDVVISNCVLNLVPDKHAAFSEICRVLKKGGHFCVSDIVLRGALNDRIRETASLYAGCVSGALQMDEYLRIIEEADFKGIEVKKQRHIHVPDEMFLEHISDPELQEFRRSGTGILSITVVGSKK